MDLTVWGWALMAAVALVVGFSKTGLPGCGILAVPLIAIAIPGQKSVGALLPMLIVADLFAVAFYARHVSLKRFLQLLPFALIGVVLGYFGLGYVGDDTTLMNRFIGISIIVLLALNAARKARPDIDERIPRNWAFAGIFGILAGILTMMANGAGPIMMIYLLAMDFDKKTFIGTGAVYFATVNIIKVPFHVALGNITAESLLLGALLVPGIIAGVYVGRWAFGRLKENWFMIAIQILTLAAAVLLIIRH